MQPRATREATRRHIIHQNGRRSARSGYFHLDGPIFDMELLRGISNQTVEGYSRKSGTGL
jgi:hypothetical protein